MSELNAALARVAELELELKKTRLSLIECGESCSKAVEDFVAAKAEAAELLSALTELMQYTPREEWVGGIENGRLIPAGAELLKTLDKCDAAIKAHEAVDAARKGER